MSKRSPIAATMSSERTASEGSARTTASGSGMAGALMTCLPEPSKHERRNRCGIRRNSEDRAFPLPLGHVEAVCAHVVVDEEPASRRQRGVNLVEHELEPLDVMQYRVAPRDVVALPRQPFRLQIPYGVVDVRDPRSRRLAPGGLDRRRRDVEGVASGKAAKLVQFALQRAGAAAQTDGMQCVGLRPEKPVDEVRGPGPGRFAAGRLEPVAVAHFANGKPEDLAPRRLRRDSRTTEPLPPRRWPRPRSPLPHLPDRS